MARTSTGVFLATLAGHPLARRVLKAANGEVQSNAASIGTQVTAILFQQVNKTDPPFYEGYMGAECTYNASITAKQNYMDFNCSAYDSDAMYVLTGVLQVR